jgi:hypothetical protein
VSDIPQEAFWAANSALFDELNPAEYEANEIALIIETTLSAALPILRKQWENDLLSDAEAMERVSAVIHGSGVNKVTRSMRTMLGRES